MNGGNNLIMPLPYHKRPNLNNCHDENRFFDYSKYNNLFEKVALSGLINMIYVKSEKKRVCADQVKNLSFSHLFTVPRGLKMHLMGYLKLKSEKKRKTNDRGFIQIKCF